MLQNDGDDFATGSPKTMRFFIKSVLPLILFLPHSPVFAMAFDSPDEQEFPAAGDDADGARMPDLEMEQDELRGNHPYAMGIGLGETVPGAVLSLVTSRNIDDRQAMQLTLGVGSRRSSDQADGESSFTNKTQTSLVDGRYLWWPSSGFPFVIDAGLSLARVQGKISDGSGAMGTYLAYTIGLGGDLGFETVFENGIWLRWVILSGRYGRLIKARYSDMTGERMSSVRNDLNELKIVGVANLTVGWSW
jgi:hypothetical protein